MLLERKQGSLFILYLKIDLIVRKLNENSCSKIRKLENLGATKNHHLCKFEKLMQKCHGMNYAETLPFCNSFVSKSKKSKIFRGFITANSDDLLNRLSRQHHVKLLSDIPDKTFMLNSLWRYHFFKK